MLETIAALCPRRSQHSMDLRRAFWTFFADRSWQAFAAGHQQPWLMAIHFEGDMTAALETCEFI